MERALLMARNVEGRLLAGLGLILLFFFASESFAAGDAGQMPAEDKDSKDVIARRTAASDAGSTAGLVLPLDHGPRATTTPWLNRQRRLKAAAEASAASAAGSGTAELAGH
jgi:hypothetical protein